MSPWFSTMRPSKPAAAIGARVRERPLVDRLDPAAGNNPASRAAAEGGRRRSAPSARPKMALSAFSRVRATASRVGHGRCSSKRSGAAPSREYPPSRARDGKDASTPRRVTEADSAPRPPRRARRSSRARALGGDQRRRRRRRPRRPCRSRSTLGAATRNASSAETKAAPSAPERDDDRARALSCRARAPPSSGSPPASSLASPRLTTRDRRALQS